MDNDYVLTRSMARLLTGLNLDLMAARESAARLERNKVDFVNIAARELRTPLTLIEGYAAMLQELRQCDQIYARWR